MSLQSLLAKIINEVKNLFSHMPSELQLAVHVGVTVAENLKSFVNSPAADILTAIIPGTLDDSIVAALRTALPKILIELKLVDSTYNLTDPAQITEAAMKVLQDMDGDIKSAFLHDISILIAQVTADGKLTWSDAVYLLEWYYKNKYQVT